MNFRLDPRQIMRYVALAWLPALLVGALAYLYVAQQPKVYNATATLYVQQANNSAGGAPTGIDISGSTQLATSYAQMVTEPVVLRTAENSLRNKYPGYHIASVTAVQGSAGGVNTTGVPSPVSPLISITLSDSVPARAADAANAVAVAYSGVIKGFEFSRFNADIGGLYTQLKPIQDKIRAISVKSAACGQTCSSGNSLATSLSAYKSIYFNLLTYIEQVKVTRNSTVNSVKLFSPATTPSVPIGPHATREALLAAVLALLLCGGAVYVYDSLHGEADSADMGGDTGPAFTGRQSAL